MPWGHSSKSRSPDVTEPNRWVPCPWCSEKPECKATGLSAEKYGWFGCRKETGDKAQISVPRESLEANLKMGVREGLYVIFINPNSEFLKGLW